MSASARTVAGLVLLAGTLALGPHGGVASSQEPLPGKHGSRLQQERAIAVKEPGPHEGGGETTAYPFFGDLADLPMVFRKRALHPGSGIGPHLQKEDEIYYVLSGTGLLTLDGRQVPVGPGTAILTRPGSTHALRQTGAEDLVIFIVYPREAGK